MLKESMGSNTLAFQVLSHDNPKIQYIFVVSLPANFKVFHLLLFSLKVAVAVTKKHAFFYQVINF